MRGIWQGHRGGWLLVHRQRSDTAPPAVRMAARPPTALGHSTARSACLRPARSELYLKLVGHKLGCQEGGYNSLQREWLLNKYQ